MASYIGSADQPGLAAYYGTTPIGPDDTVADVLARGGIAVFERPTAGKDAASVDAGAHELGSWAGLVEVGGFQAAVIHADPIGTRVRPEGVRPYYVFWSDGVHDWELRAGTSTAEQAIDAARAVACQ